MDRTIEKTWDMIEETIKKTQLQEEVSRNENAYDMYKERFNFWYHFIKDKYMDEEVKFLDRHKVAGIVVVSLIESKSVFCKKDVPNDKTFFGQYLVAMCIGIIYMQNRLNTLLLKLNKEPIKEIWMPEHIFTCNNSYFDITSRNLYFEDTDDNFSLNPLEIAKELFILEYVTVINKDIDPQILKEKKNQK